MTNEPVVSCPTCYRQYVVTCPTTDKIGKCLRCNAFFEIYATKPYVGETEYVEFDSPIAPRFGFFQDGCAEFARNATELLRSAGHPVTQAALLMIAKTMARSHSELLTEVWRQGFCNQALAEAYRRGYGDRAEMPHGVFRYFWEYIPSLSYDSLYMLDAAFNGVLSVEFETPAGKKLAVIKRTRIERWRVQLREWLSARKVRRAHLRYSIQQPASEKG